MEMVYRSSLYRLWLAFCRALNGSVLVGGTQALICRSRNKSRGSAIMRALSREGVIARAWRGSGICRLLNLIFNFPLWLLRKIYAALKPQFERSVFAALAFRLGDETAIAQSWIIILLWSIPFIHWDNAYNLMAYVLLLCMFFIRGMRKNDARIEIGRIGVYPVLMFLAACAAVPLSTHPELSSRFLVYHIVCALCVAVTVSAVRDEEDLKRLCAGAAAAVFVAAAYGVYQGIKGVPVNASYVDLRVNVGMPGRVQSFFDNPNTFAEVLIILLPLVAALMLCSRRLTGRLAALCAFAVGAAALGMTYSRASWVGAVVAAVAFVLIWRPRLFPAFAVLCLLCVPFLPSTIFNRILTIGNTSDSSTQSRVPLYQAAIKVIGRAPVTGAGLGTSAVQQYIWDNHLYSGTAPYTHAHNIYLEMWVEMGIAGIVGFVGSMLWNIKNAVRKVRRCGDCAARTITAAGAASLCGAMVAGLADYLWQYPRVMSMFWFVFAVVLAGIKVCPDGDGENRE